MKYISLVRHAKSSWKDTSLADIDRPLNKRGKHDAPLLGERIAERGWLPDKIICSPSKRTRKTYKCLIKTWPASFSVDYREEPLLYEASLHVLVSLLRDIDADEQHIMLIGHNPGLTELTNFLGDQEIENVPTCGWVLLTLDTTTWHDIRPHGGRVELFDYPKLYSA